MLGVLDLDISLPLTTTPPFEPQSLHLLTSLLHPFNAHSRTILGHLWVILSMAKMRSTFLLPKAYILRVASHTASNT